MYPKLIARAWPVPVALFLAAGAVCGWAIRRMEIDTGTNMLLNENDPDLHYYNRTRADWEYDEYTIVCVRRDDWFTPEGIRLLNELTDELARVPHVDKILAIHKAPLLRVRPPTALFGRTVPTPARLDDPKLLEGKYGSLETMLERARAEFLGGEPPPGMPGVPLGGHTQFLGNLISPDGRNLSILVYLKVSDDVRRLEPEWNRLHGEPDTPATRAKIAALKPDYERSIKALRDNRLVHVRAIREVCARWNSRFPEPVRLSGITIVNVNLGEHVEADMRTFGIAAAAMFVLGFAAVFRKIRWTVLPILACVLPVVLVVGSMALLGKRITVITSNMPVLLFVLMLPYTVYFIERWRELRAADPSLDAAASAAGAGRDIWVPCLYSAATTMAGTASLLTSGIHPVRTFGLMMTVGMALGLGTVFLFLPSAVRPLRVLPATAPTAKGPLHRLAGAALGAPVLVLLVSLAVLGVSIWGTTKLTVETKFIDYFRQKSEVYQGLEYIDVRMGGTTPMEVMLRSDKPGYFKTPEGFAAMRAVQAYFDTVPETGNVRSLATLVDEARKSPRAFPKEFGGKEWSDADALDLILTAAKPLVRDYCTPDFTTARILVRMKETAPTLNRKKILDGLRRHLDTHPDLAGLAEKRPTGVFVLYSNMLQSLIRSQKDTFFIVLAAIFAMLIALFRNPILAALVLLPQMLPVFVVLGTMGFLGIALDMVTTMIASMAMGVGIDPAIQYAVRFRRELAGAATREEAVLRAHDTIGRAIAVGGGIVTMGFSVLVLSKFVPTVYFGVFTGLAVLIGIVASLTTLPAMFVLLRYPRK